MEFLRISPCRNEAFRTLPAWKIQTFKRSSKQQRLWGAWKNHKGRLNFLFDCSSHRRRLFVSNLNSNWTAAYFFFSSSSSVSIDRTAAAAAGPALFQKCSFKTNKTLSWIVSGKKEREWKGKLNRSGKIKGLMLADRATNLPFSISHSAFNFSLIWALMFCNYRRFGCRVYIWNLVWSVNIRAEPTGNETRAQVVERQECFCGDIWSRQNIFGILNQFDGKDWVVEERVLSLLCHHARQIVQSNLRFRPNLNNVRARFLLRKHAIIFRYIPQQRWCHISTIVRENPLRKIQQSYSKQNRVKFSVGR